MTSLNVIVAVIMIGVVVRMVMVAMGMIMVAGEGNVGGVALERSGLNDHFLRRAARQQGGAPEQCDRQ